MTANMQARVDPRPVRPPTLGLIASANNVIEGTDGLLDEHTEDQTQDFDASNASGPRPVIPGEQPSADYELTSDGKMVHWIRGFSYRPEVCNGGDIIMFDSAAPGTPSAAPSQVDVTPYIVEGTDIRSTFGTPHDIDLLEGRQFARRQLLACESKQIEKELWTGKLTNGTLTGNRYLADTSVVLPEGARLLGYLTALAVLERAINDNTCGQQGMIHARADLVSFWNTGGALRRVGNLILTIHDTIVVPGAGYNGQAPALGTPGIGSGVAGIAPSADSSWAYATTVVDVRRGAFFSPETIHTRLDKSANTLRTYERRVAAATWGCLQVGVWADHINSVTTTGS